MYLPPQSRRDPQMTSVCCKVLFLGQETAPFFSILTDDWIALIPSMRHGRPLLQVECLRCKWMRLWSYGQRKMMVPWLIYIQLRQTLFPLSSETGVCIFMNSNATTRTATTTTTTVMFRKYYHSTCHGNLQMSKLKPKLLCGREPQQTPLAWLHPLHSSPPPLWWSLRVRVVQQQQHAHVWSLHFWKRIRPRSEFLKGRVLNCPQGQHCIDDSGWYLGRVYSVSNTWFIL